MKVGIIFFVLFGAMLSFSEEIEFSGFPEKKIEIDEKGSSTYSVNDKDREKYKILITRIEDKYFWASRNNIPLLKIEGGSYVTYVAVTGAGYIKVCSPMIREMWKKMSPAQRKESFLYAEHLSHMLGSITYFGF